jgi:hypothetical protein
MSKKQDRMVYKRDDGSWANQRQDASRASSTHVTQKEAISTARNMLKNQGGGELTIKGTNGLIRAKDTVSPGKDPYPPPG